MKARKFVFASIFDGEPKPSDIKLETEELPTLKDGGIKFSFVIFLKKFHATEFFVLTHCFSFQLD